ncbi:MAG: hypothetical protein NVS4B8_16940 [Herpetosiphon sp.]
MYTELDVSSDRQALQELLASGFRSTPVTMINGNPVLGFKPQELTQLLEAT